MTCPHENAHVGSKLLNGGWEHICNHCHAVVGDSISGRYVAAPTPPASPTVTLQRWSFVTDRREGCPVAFTNPNGQWVKYEDALALLRAAKRQQ